MNVSEGVLQGLEPSEVLVSLGLPVSTLGTILVQNAIKGRSTHFNNLNQTKLFAWHLAYFLHMQKHTFKRFIVYSTLAESIIAIASDGPPFTSAHFFCAPSVPAYSPASPGTSDLPSCSFSSLSEPQTSSSAPTANHRKSVAEAAMMS